MGIDEHIGELVRQRRDDLAIGLSNLANDLGMSAAELADLESGRERIRAVQLYRIARRLGVPLSYFYAGLSALVEPDDTLPDVARLIEAFQLIADPAERKRVLDLAESLADGKAAVP